MVETKKQKFDRDANVDPISGEIGSHPVGTGVGTLTGGTAGAMVGAAAGPVGAVAGAIIGGVGGAYAGKDAAEGINPTVINTYWNENYSSRPYVKADADYETYKPAYMYGYNARTKNADRKFDEIESDLSKNWSKERQASTLEWNDAKEAVRDSYDYTDKLYNEKKNNNNKF
jgi:uncharacterized protein YcfJ